MKKGLSLILVACFSAGMAYAQNEKASEGQYTVPDQRYAEEPTEFNLNRQVPRKSSSANVIWSEDFSNGIPSTWQNQGFDIDATGNFIPNPLCQWEYRGPNTTPDNTIGSRGAFSGSQAPLNSPTRSNGFVIFDSDYLDNGGNSTNMGGGDSPAPHVGTLTTDTIDCSSLAYVMVRMQSYAREFFADLRLTVSNDGGVTFADTFVVHELAVNSSSANAEEVIIDISSVAGNQSEVMLQFVFDGRPGNANGNSYYFWMLDDIEVAELPPNQFKFVDWRGAPDKDVIYPTRQPRYGRPQIDQAAQMPVNFDANILNFGWRDQSNVTLKVEIVDAASNSVVTTLTSGAVTTLASGDTGSFNDFNTSTAWTPSASGDYYAVFSVESDSVPSNGISPSDTIPFRISDWTHAGHFGFLDNTIGVANGAVSLAQVFTFPSDVDTNGYILVEGISTYISSVSDTTGSIIVEIYDSTGFSYGGSGGPAGSPAAIRTLSLNSGNVGQVTNIDFTTNGVPLALQANKGYLVVFNLIPNASNGDMRLGNDQTVRQAGGLIGMLFNDGNWYSGFSNSRTLSNLIINVHLGARVSSLDEALAMRNALKLYPNPSQGEVNLEINRGGHYELEVVSYSGQRWHLEEVSVSGSEVLTRDFSHLPRGSYLINLRSGEFSTSKKLMIE